MDISAAGEAVPGGFNPAVSVQNPDVAPEHRNTWRSAMGNSLQAVTAWRGGQAERRYPVCRAGLPELG